MPESAVPPPPLPSLCWDCARTIDAVDRYCSHCGQGQGDFIPWYYKPWGIAVSTLLGLGPFGLILVWRSPRLSNGERWVWSAAILSATAWLCWRVYQLVQTVSFVLNSALKGL